MSLHVAHWQYERRKYKQSVRSGWRAYNPEMHQYSSKRLPIAARPPPEISGLHPQILITVLAAETP
jgi:hypothetical protein